MKVVFIAYDGILTQSVFDSQILTPLEIIRKKHGARCHLVAYENIQSYFKRFSELRKKKEEVEKKTGIKCLFLPRIPGFKGLRLSGALLPSLVKAKGILSRNEPAIIHSRGAKGASIGVRLKRHFPLAKVIFDARDSEPEQYVSEFLKGRRFDLKNLPKEMGALYDKLSVHERFASVDSDHVFTQSQELKKALKKKYGVPDNKFTVFPNSVSLNSFGFHEQERRAVRKELGIEDRFVLIYCGTVHPYQLPEEGVLFFKKLLEYAPDSFFLAITFSPEKVTELLRKAGIMEKDYKVTKVRYTEVSKYLNAGDAGILFRVQNEYSKTSSPVKFPEYLSAGLYILTLTGIGDATAFVGSHQAGLVLENTDERTLEQGARKLAQLKDRIQSSEEKLRISNLAARHFSQEAQIEEKFKCYQRLLEN